MKNSPFEGTEIIYPTALIQTPYTVQPFVIVGLPWGEKELVTTIGERSFLRSHTIIYAGVTIGTDFVCGHHALIRENTQIGNHVSVGSGSVVEHHVKIGNNVRIHSQAFIPEFCVLEDEAWIGPHVTLTNAKYPRSPHAKEELKGVYIEKGAKVGAHAVVLPGVRIGHHALVGAGAVVTHDVPPEAVVVGNPAKVVKYIRDLPY